MGARKFVLEFVITAQDKASAVLGQVKEGFAETANIPVDFADLGNRAGAALGGIVARLPEITAETFKLGAATQAAENRFTKFAGGTKQAEEFLTAFQTATDGTVDKLGAMEGASKLLQMGLVGTSDEMGQVAAIATKLGDQTVGASDRIADFALLLANQSIPRLDNFGISSGTVRKRIDELQKSVTGMTREAAFQQAVLEQGSKSLAILGDTSELATTKMDKIAAATQDAKIGFGEMLVNIVDGAQGVDDFAARIRQVPETLGLVINGLFAVNAGLTGLMRGGPIKAMEMFDEKFKQMSGHVEKVNQGIAKTTATIGTYAGMTQVATSVQDGASTAIEETTIAIEEESNAISRIDGVTQGRIRANKAFMQSEQQIEDAILGTIAAMEQEAEQMQRLEELALGTSMTLTDRAQREQDQAEDFAKREEDLEQTHTKKMAAIQAKGRASAIKFDEEAHLTRLDKLKERMEIALQSQSEFTGKTKESSRMSKDLQIKTLQEQINEETHQLDAYYGGRLVKQGQNITGLLKQEEGRYAEELTMLQEARAEQEEEQRQSLGRMLLQHLESWAAINGVTGEELLKMQLDVSAKYGLITDTAANKAQQMADNWAVELARMRGEAVSFFDLYMERFEALPDEKVIELRFEMATPTVADEGRMGGETFAEGVDTMVGPGFGGPMVFMAGEGGEPERVTVTPITNNNFTMNVTTGAGSESVQMGFREMEALAQ